MAVEGVVELAADLGLVLAVVSDAEVLDDADVLLGGDGVPAPFVEVDRGVAEGGGGSAGDEGAGVEVAIGDALGIAEVELAGEVVFHAVGIGAVGEEGALIVGVVVGQLVAGEDAADGESAAIGAVEAECPTTDEGVDGVGGSGWPTCDGGRRGGRR